MVVVRIFLNVFKFEIWFGFENEFLVFKYFVISIFLIVWEIKSLEFSFFLSVRKVKRV